MIKGLENLTYEEMLRDLVCSAQRAEGSEYEHCHTKIAADTDKSHALTDLNSTEKYVPKKLYFVLLWSITNVRNARKTFMAFKQPIPLIQCRHKDQILDCPFQTL